MINAINLCKNEIQKGLLGSGYLARLVADIVNAVSLVCSCRSDIVLFT